MHTFDGHLDRVRRSEASRDGEFKDGEGHCGAVKLNKALSRRFRDDYAGPGDSPGAKRRDLVRCWPCSFRYAWKFRMGELHPRSQRHSSSSNN
jgi:hypothetical protein